MRTQPPRQAILRLPAQLGRFIDGFTAVANLEARQDWRIIQDIARCLGRERGFIFAHPREIFDELRRASRGGIADYSGITYERLDAGEALHWPCPSTDHPGTPRLFLESFPTPDGRARFAPHSAFIDPATPPDAAPRESIELRTLVFNSA